MTNLYQKTQIQAFKKFYSKNIEKIRNFGIIAHVDVGKTTLVDCLLKETASIKSDHEDRAMDSNPLEKERGITILSKWTVVKYGDNHLNIIDTPGHADFGGEVERILSMVDGVCLLVDATEGVMAQTKFVVSKALSTGLKPIVVINKVDRESARVTEVENEIFDLFVSLNATDEQLDFPILYASAKNGWAVNDLENEERKNMIPLFESILEHIPQPKIVENQDFSMLITSLETDRHHGRILTGRITSGSVKLGDKIKAMTREGKQVENVKVSKLFTRVGLNKLEDKEAFAGDIISVAGCTKAGVTDTLCAPSISTPIETKPIDPPIISVMFQSNDSPFAGKEGKLCSSILLRNRLMKEGDSNITLQIVPHGGEKFEILARGEMQIGILIETMRREGFEFAVSSPQVLYRKGENGETLEPIEDLTIECEETEYATVNEKLSSRKGDLLDFKKLPGGKIQLKFKIPTRCLIGFRSEFISMTRGSGVMQSLLDSFQPFKGDIGTVRKGVLISMAEGKATAYALQPLEARGSLFITPQTQIYEGMIIGSCAKEKDLEVNPCKEKHLTNMRASGSEENIRLSPVKRMTIEDAITYIQPDELIEVTPQSIRLRKKLLTETERKKASRSSKKQFE